MRTWPKHMVNPEQVQQLGKGAYGKAAYTGCSVHSQSGSVAAAR